MTINPNNTTVVCSGGDHRSIDECEAIARIINPELFVEYDLLVKQGTSAENGKPWAQVVFGTKIERLREQAATIIALRTQASAPRSASAGDGVREALEALSMWCTSERRKIRGRGGFDDQTEREIGIGIVEAEIDRRVRLLALASNPLEGKGIQSNTEQASSGLRSTKQREG